MDHPRDAHKLVLGIESSCDESAASVVRAREDDARVEIGEPADEILSSVVASQHELHEEYRGVVPEIASRAHAERLLPVVRAAIGEAGISLEQIDAIAVGNRPGLIGSLLVGVASAKALAWSLGVPLVGVDHVHAHLYAGLMQAAGGGEICKANPAPTWPAIGLVVSGGHSSIYVCDSLSDIRRVGSTIDDAIGEAYDKVASILGLAYPGGPSVDHLAQTGDERAHEFPISRLAKGSLDFSFSGL